MKKTIKWVLVTLITLTTSVALAHMIYQHMSYEFMTPQGDKVWVRLDTGNVLHVYYGEQSIHIGSRTNFCQPVH